MYVIPGYFSSLKLQVYPSQCGSWTFSREIKKQLRWVIEAINEASATNSMMNLSRTLYVIADAKNTLLYSLKF